MIKTNPLPSRSRPRIRVGECTPRLAVHRGGMNRGPWRSRAEAGRCRAVRPAGGAAGRRDRLRGPLQACDRPGACRPGCAAPRPRPGKWRRGDDHVLPVSTVAAQSLSVSVDDVVDPA